MLNPDMYVQRSQMRGFRYLKVGWYQLLDSLNLEMVGLPAPT